MGQLAELEVAEFWFCVVQVLNITIFAVLYLIVFAGDISGLFFPSQNLAEGMKQVSTMDQFGPF